jgi:hypothetical protein
MQSTFSANWSKPTSVIGGSDTKIPIHQTHRRFVLGGRREVVEISSGGQEDRDNGLLLGRAQSAPEFREYSPLLLPNRLKKGVRLIPRYDHLGRIIALPSWVQEEDNLSRGLCYSQLCSTSSQGLSTWKIDEHARFLPSEPLVLIVNLWLVLRLLEGRSAVVLEDVERSSMRFIF